MEQYEGIARRYCELMGVDPDESVTHSADPGPDGYVPAVCLYSPRWRLIAREAKSQIAWLQAIGLYSAPETIPAPEASIVKAFQRSPRRVEHTAAHDCACDECVKAETPVPHPPFGQCTAVVNDGSQLCSNAAEPGKHRCAQHSLNRRASHE